MKLTPLLFMAVLLGHAYTASSDSRPSVNFLSEYSVPPEPVEDIQVYEVTPNALYYSMSERERTKNSDQEKLSLLTTQEPGFIPECYNLTETLADDAYELLCSDSELSSLLIIAPEIITNTAPQTDITITWKPGYSFKIPDCGPSQWFCLWININHGAYHNQSRFLTRCDSQHCPGNCCDFIDCSKASISACPECCDALPVDSCCRESIDDTEVFRGILPESDDVNVPVTHTFNTGVSQNFDVACDDYEIHVIGENPAGDSAELNITRHRMQLQISNVTLTSLGDEAAIPLDSDFYNSLHQPETLEVMLFDCVSRNLSLIPVNSERFENDLLPAPSLSVNQSYTLVTAAIKLNNLQQPEYVCNLARTLRRIKENCETSPSTPMPTTLPFYTTVVTEVHNDSGSDNLPAIIAGSVIGGGAFIAVGIGSIVGIILIVKRFYTRSGDTELLQLPPNVE